MPLGKKISPKKTAEKKNNSKGMKKKANPRDTPESIKWKDKHYRYRKKIKHPDSTTQASRSYRAEAGHDTEPPPPPSRTVTTDRLQAGKNGECTTTTH